MSTDPLTPEERLEAFAARALELPELLQALLPFAHSSLGRRALLELAPAEDELVRARLGRLREVQPYYWRRALDED